MKKLFSFIRFTYIYIYTYCTGSEIKDSKYIQQLFNSIPTNHYHHYINNLKVISKKNFFFNLFLFFLPI